MAVPMKRIYLMVGILTVLCLALVAGSGVVFAKGHEAPLNQNITCEANTQQPHNSTHFPGRINVVGTVECTGNVQELEIRVTLQEENCLLLICWWDNVGTPGEDKKSWTSQIKENSSIACAPGHYRGFSEEGSCGPTVMWKQATVTQARGRFPADPEGRLLTGGPGG